MNDKLIQLIDKLWSIEPSITTKRSVCWQYKNCSIELTKYDVLQEEYFTIYVSRDHKTIISVGINIPEAKYLTWKLNLIKAFDKFSNTLLDTLLEEDDASCFDDLLESSKNG